jgi:hypothetical protein
MSRSDWLALRLTEDEKLQLRALADALGVSMAEAIRQGIELRRIEWLRNQVKSKRAKSA